MWPRWPPSPIVGPRWLANTSPSCFAGLVEATREGRRMLYRLRGSYVRALLAEALFHGVSGVNVPKWQGVRRLMSIRGSRTPLDCH